MEDELCGVYSDPFHGSCLRVISQVSAHDYVVSGAYGDDEQPRKPNEPWKATIHRDGKFLIVDFSGKTVNHAAVYSALWCPTVREIHWEDGNTWKKLYAAKDQLGCG